MRGRRTSALGVALLGFLLPACGASVADPRPQWTILVQSDAPVPQFADRLLVEVLDERGIACSGCRRQFGISDTFGLPLSFGIAAEGIEGPLHVRARLYRAVATGADGLPAGVGMIDSLGRLPDIEEPVSVTLGQFMSCFGVLSDFSSRTTCDPTTGELAPEPELDGDQSELPSGGSWAPAAEVGCSGDVPAGMVCVPGGAFLLGGRGAPVVDADLESLPEQVVQVAPFALDVDEFTVGALKTLVANGSVAVPREHDPDEGSADWPCTYVSASAERDAFPVNCLPRASAEAACVALGKRLPTEAEWEFAAGNGSLETAQPWGDFDATPCVQAWVGRGRTAVEQLEGSLVVENPDCRFRGDGVGPTVGGSPQDLTDDGIRNLSGNLSEWVLDDFVGYASSDCWNGGARLFVDPQCVAPDAPAAVKGASWASVPRDVTIVTRNRENPLASTTEIGFRCAVSMR